jgi:hypothetical protein
MLKKPFLGELRRFWGFEPNRTLHEAKRLAEVILKKLGVIKGKLYF